MEKSGRDCAAAGVPVWAGQQGLYDNSGLYNDQMLYEGGGLYPY